MRLSGRRPWWKTRARPIIAGALAPHLSDHEAKEAAGAIMDALQEKGLRIVRDHKAPPPAPYTVVGWGPFRLPGERRAWRNAEEKTREMLDSIEQDKDDEAK